MNRQFSGEEGGSLTTDPIVRPVLHTLDKQSSFNNKSPNKGLERQCSLGKAVVIFPNSDVVIVSTNLNDANPSFSQYRITHSKSASAISDTTASISVGSSSIAGASSGSPSLYSLTRMGSMKSSDTSPLALEVVKEDSNKDSRRASPQFETFSLHQEPPPPPPSPPGDEGDEIFRIAHLSAFDNNASVDPEITSPVLSRAFSTTEVQHRNSRSLTKRLMARKKSLSAIAHQTATIDSDTSSTPSNKRSIRKAKSEKTWRRASLLTDRPLTNSPMAIKKPSKRFRSFSLLPWNWLARQKRQAEVLENMENLRTNRHRSLTTPNASFARNANLDQHEDVIIESLKANDNAVTATAAPSLSNRVRQDDMEVSVVCPFVCLNTV
jgi:hypothetical protein